MLEPRRWEADAALAQRAFAAVRNAAFLVPGQKKSSSTAVQGARSVGEVAAAADVSRAVLVRAKRILHDGVPELIAAVESGQMGFYSATRIVRGVPKDAQAVVVDKVLAMKGNRRLQTALGVAAPPRVHRDYPVNQRRERAIRQIENAATVLQETDDRPLPLDRAQVEGWISVLKFSLPIVRDFYHHLNNNKGGP